jgi:hypothetical protein
MCILASASPAASAPLLPLPARLLPPDQRQQLALDALAGVPVAHLAEQHHVSRPFVYRQQAKAQAAVAEAFAPESPADERVLFYLPVTKAWLQQCILSLTLTCHSPFRGVLEHLEDLFAVHVSLGTVSNVLRGTVNTARRHNTAQDLRPVRLGAHDEIYQAGRPVLVGADVNSTYCYLLSPEEHCDADTWGVRLLELRDQGLRPDATIADAGTALRAGQAEAWPDTPCRGDVFHLLQPVEELVGYLVNRAGKAIAARTALEQQLARARRPTRHPPAAGRRRQRQRRQCRLAGRLPAAVQEEARAITLADDAALLCGWLRDDILAVAGPGHATRQELYDFVVAELQARAPGCPHRLGPVVTHLVAQRDAVLAFAAALDADLAALAQQFQVPVAVVRELLQVQALPARQPAHWQRQAALRRRLRGRFHRLAAAVGRLVRHTVRASSVIENLNSRLRAYFFLRRQLGPEYLDLLRFYLNHRRFPRSERPERVGHSPAELLSGQEHPHWLELLGYQRFRRE